MATSSKTEIEYVEFGVPGDKVLVPRIGLGCMGLTSAYAAANDEESVQVMRHAVDIGCSFWDTADVYGVGQNERLLSQVLKDSRDKVFVCTKFGHEFEEPKTEGELFHKYIKGLNGSPEYIKKAADASLRRLGVDKIDLYYQHRVDPNVPIEETVGAMAELVKEGKVRYLGLSECSAETLRRAYKVHPIAAVQYEYNAWSLDLETNGLLDACRELGVTLVAYSPLGRGFLSGTLRKFEDLEENDIRRTHPRFQRENFDNNLKLVDAFEKLAEKKGCTTSQLALAWVLAQDKNLIVIPGTKRIKYLDSNVAAGDVKLNEDDLKEIRAVIDSTPVVGHRYPEKLAKWLNN
ncbi:aldo-keto reductase [Martensiomyces pterosporus]|nr:aldo-keto reductase [Martensiomyces pterosporus]